MPYDDTVNGVAQAFLAGASGQAGKSQGGGMLAAAKAGRTGGAGGESASETQAAQDMKTIKEKGFRAFVEELQARKLAELREKILRGMGLSEEDLQEMDVDQRAAIEKLIAEKIRERLAAQTEIEAEIENDKEGDNGSGAGKPDKPGEITAQTLAARTGLGAGYAVLQALDNADPAGLVPPPKDEG